MDNLQWETIAYKRENGAVPVEEFLDILPAKHAEKILRDIELLERFGPRWGMPHVENMGDGLWQLRTKHGTNIFRVFFFIWHDKILVLTHGFAKKGLKTPPRDIERARRYRDDWLKRKGE